MLYILNTPVSENKKCVIAFSKIFGLGFIMIMQICEQLGISPQIKCKHLTANQIDQITRCISQNYLVGGDLKRRVHNNKERHISVNSFRGFRYIEKLPCRGQRTHGNAQTVRRLPGVDMSFSGNSARRKPKINTPMSVPYSKGKRPIKSSSRK